MVIQRLMEDKTLRERENLKVDWLKIIFHEQILGAKKNAV